MRAFDFAPLYRSTVGFDRMAALLDNLLSSEGANAPAYPPYNIEKTGEDSYRITFAVAGFAPEDVSVEMRDGQLVVSAARKRPEEAAAEGAAAPRYLHRGIAERGFERRIQLADHVKAVGASMELGLLHIELVREIPEALKPRRIEISAGAAPAAARLEAAAA